MTYIDSWPAFENPNIATVTAVLLALAAAAALAVPVVRVARKSKRFRPQSLLLLLVPALIVTGGARIDATPRGYLLGAAAAGYTGLVACCHSTTEGMRRELYAVVDQGGVVVDVIVENALYGEIRANLNVASRYDADAFVRQAEGSPASLLSRMTGGVHLHTIRCADEAAFRRIQAALAEAGVLYEKE